MHTAPGSPSTPPPHIKHVSSLATQPSIHTLHYGPCIVPPAMCHLHYGPCIVPPALCRLHWPLYSPLPCPHRLLTPLNSPLHATTAPSPPPPPALRHLCWPMHYAPWPPPLHILIIHHYSWLVSEWPQDQKKGRGCGVMWSVLLQQHNPDHNTGPAAVLPPCYTHSLLLPPPDTPATALFTAGTRSYGHVCGVQTHTKPTEAAALWPESTHPTHTKTYSSCCSTLSHCLAADNSDCDLARNRRGY
jgi:hypothetical protein